jgi:hypothetical protein
MSSKIKVDVIEVFDNLWLETLQKNTHDIYHLPGYAALEAMRSQTIRLIIDEDNYNYLLAARAKHLNVDIQELINSNFFPAYRAPDNLNIS